MNNLALLLIGIGVTVLTCLAMAPLVWAAILDGRYDDEQQRINRTEAPTAPTVVASAAEEKMLIASKVQA